MQRPVIGLIGAGRVGSALTAALSRGGCQIGPIWSRSEQRAARAAAGLPGAGVAGSPAAVAKGAALVIVAVPDRAITATVAQVRWCAGTAVVHTSGGTPVAALDSAYQQGAEIGGWHPLKSFAGRDADADLRGITFAIEADPPLRETLHALTEAVGGAPLELRADDRALYHASAVLASNALVALLARAASLWTPLGRSRGEALRALLPLVQGTVQNLESLGLPAALTGPVERGDVTTVAGHLAALATAAPAVADVYALLSRGMLALAEEKGGIEKQNATALTALLTRHVSGVGLE